MDTIGLLAAWVGIVSFLLVSATLVVTNHTISPLQHWWASTDASRARRRIVKLEAALAQSDQTATPDLFDIINLWANMLLTLIVGIGTVLTSILILDLGPALLAAVLPFNLNAKLITRGTGVFLFISSYLLIFRLCYLATKIRNKSSACQPESTRREILELRKKTV